MIYVDIFLLLMIVLSLIFISIPLSKYHASWSLWLIALIMLPTLSLSLYYFSSDRAGLKNWLNGGAAHYVLMSKIDHLGGVDGIIQAINLRLKNNPDDFQGWMILGKLYLSQQNYPQAEKALLQAQRIKPDSPKIKELLGLLPSKNKNF